MFIDICMYIHIYIYISIFINFTRAGHRRVTREHPHRVYRPLPEIQGQRQALTVLHVPSSLDRGA